MNAGLTAQQRSLLEQFRCSQGHRFDGINYPTPEGQCPLCTWPEVRQELDRQQWLPLSETDQPRASLHPSLTTM